MDLTLGSGAEPTATMDSTDLERWCSANFHSAFDGLGTAIYFTNIYNNFEYYSSNSDFGLRVGAKESAKHC